MICGAVLGVDFYNFFYKWVKVNSRLVENAKSLSTWDLEYLCSDPLYSTKEAKDIYTEVWAYMEQELEHS